MRVIELSWMTNRKRETLLLSRKEVEAVLTMKDTIDAMAKAFADHIQKKTQMIKRRYVRPKTGRIGFMSAYVESFKSAGVKVVSTFHDNPSKYDLPSITATIILNDTDTGFPYSIMDGTFITMMRTGAVSALATKYLARKDSKIAGIIGAGVQGKGQLIGLMEVCNLKKAYCYSRTYLHRKEFAVEMSTKLGIDVIPVDSAEKAVRNSDILATATPSMTPVIMKNWVKPGTHINTVGGSSKGEQEIATEVFQTSKLVVDDFTNAAMLGQITQPVARGELKKEDIHAELGEIILSQKSGRTSDEEITVFVSSGMAIQDVATAHIVFQKAVRRGLGIKFRFL